MVEPIRDHWVIALGLIAVVAIVVWLLASRGNRARGGRP